VLAKANRITSADDYRVIVRRGAKVAGAHTVSYLRSRESGTDARFGFIVSKKVGTAVRRNLVRRRLKAACHEAVVDGIRGVDVVVRALPGAADAPWRELRAEVLDALARPTAGSAGSARRTGGAMAPGSPSRSLSASGTSTAKGA
jgi:ribonuclease P protein component